uniref:Uncharacterized protein n=1 Tax=Anguilla anguilla TaxID=7936 RepID=A0A0E9VCA9_ANGAN
MASVGADFCFVPALRHLILLISST